jgi:hypothetical protein
VPPRPAIHVISRPADWSVMTAPVRFELLEAMRSIAPCSVRELAAATDRPADSIYPHFRQLLKIGVVVDAGERRGRTRPERVYDLVADDFRPIFRGAKPAATARAVDRSIQTMAGIVANASKRAAAAGRYVYTETDQNVVGKVENAWLTRDEFLELREKFREIKTYLDARKARRGDGSLHVAAFFVIPVTRRRGARVAAPARRTDRARAVPGKSSSSREKAP